MGDSKATEIDVEFGFGEAMGEEALHDAAAGEDGAAVGGREGAPGESTQGLGEEGGEGVFVLCPAQTLRKGPGYQPGPPAHRHDEKRKSPRSAGFFSFSTL